MKQREQSQKVTQESRESWREAVGKWQKGWVVFAQNSSDCLRRMRNVGRVSVSKVYSRSKTVK